MGKTISVITDQELLERAKNTLQDLTSSNVSGRNQSPEELAVNATSLFVGMQIINLIELHINQSSVPDEEFNTVPCFAPDDLAH